MQVWLPAAVFLSMSFGKPTILSECNDKGEGEAHVAARTPTSRHGPDVVICPLSSMRRLQSISTKSLASWSILSADVASRNESSSSTRAVSPCCIFCLWKRVDTLILLITHTHTHT